MDYKKLASDVKLCGSSPASFQCMGGCSYYSGGDMMKCIPRMTADAASAIADLLSSIEAAETQSKINADALSIAAKGNAALREKLEAEEERAGKAEMERDAAIEDLRQMCVGGNTCAFCKHGSNCGKQGTGRKTVEPCWEWRGKKGE